MIAYDGQDIPDSNSNTDMNFSVAKTAGLSCAQMQRHDSEEKNRLFQQKSKDTLKHNLL